ASVPSPRGDASEDEQRLVIEEELSRLPESLRLPVVMCYLEGLTNAQAARCIGCPEGTVVSRLARARDRLRRRLRARGIAVVGAAALTGLLCDGAAAMVAPSLLHAAISFSMRGGTMAAPLVSAQVARVADAVVRSMRWQRILWCSAAVFFGTAFVGT